MRALVPENQVFPGKFDKNTKRREVLIPVSSRDEISRMTTTDDDPVASWQERVGSLRKRGRTSAAALSVVPVGEIDVRRGRPPAPERLSQAEREL